MRNPYAYRRPKNSTVLERLNMLEPAVERMDEHGSIGARRRARFALIGFAVSFAFNIFAVAGVEHAVHLTRDESVARCEDNNARFQRTADRLARLERGAPKDAVTALEYIRAGMAPIDCRHPDK